ncbi:Rne/Rng family ribonuclease [Sneathiella marina]|uniref:Ribonuclease E n=1 Tax=Sneathiella marina TaxID=2950108 RepID=A0ABY4VXF0_9PROT|nr:ribonuclease E/G [Sneathiella marina]USG59493.1 Rne/Rng family ribonuclease [Sneathiella marina]
MATRMLVDASHEEETRVVIVKGTRLEEFDYETASRKQLKGNIYLAKVTRVEPSLQAAFVEYGGNRHGFLPFSEIHPDYYQVPVSDREVLLEQEVAAEKEAHAQEEAEDDAKSIDDDNLDTAEVVLAAEAMADAEVVESDDEEGIVDDVDDTIGGLETVGEDGEENFVENLGGEDDVEPRRKAPSRRHYKIQEVIKRRQILLIQVVKEERGNKGAALTTYISLPGRYSVLMPNTGRGGGISRKIANPADRKRLKKIANELDVPEGVGVIIRTAGMSRTKVEIKRDYEFLMRVWDDIRELTLKSMAPYCVYEEANLIKRSIRDLYTKEISEILIEGDDGYKLAKEFMRKLMPSHAKKVQPYKDKIPLFHRFQVEQQFASMYNPEVQLKSGGYIVINPTEALVSIDVNSGKATKERNVEDTATKTNLEAAEEIARQLRLRDLAGLIVIDFIDMDDNRNNKAVERRMKDCLKSDRARIQVGRISPFGLMEMSRQRLRPSFLETSTNICHTCGGSGFVRSIESTALLIIRTLEEEGVRERSAKITITVHTDVAIYLLNQKRSVIQELENIYGMTILILADPTTNLNDHEILREKGKPGDLTPVVREAVSTEISGLDDETADTSESAEEEQESNSSKRRRRRRRRKPREDNATQTNEDQAEDTASSNDASGASETSADDDEGNEPKRRRRGRRGGRRRSRSNASEENSLDENAGSSESSDSNENVQPSSESDAVVIPITTAESSTAVDAKEENVAEEPKKRTRRTRKKQTDTASGDANTAESAEQAGDLDVPSPSEGSEEKQVRPRRRRATQKKTEDTVQVAEKVDTVVKAADAVEAPTEKKAEPEAPPVVEAVIDEKPKAKRSGWWRRGS